MPPGPSPTPRGMFTYVPAQDELSSNVVGLDVYNEDKQNIGTIKDIALDEAGFELARLAVKAKSELARISAIRELLDRGFGKPTQFLAADSEIIPKDTTLEQLREDILIEFAASFPDLEIVPKKRLTVIAGTDEAT